MLIRRGRSDLTLAPRHLIVEVERAYLELLLQNLLANAPKYSAPGLPIEIETREGQGEAHVRVLDRGIGFSDEDAAELFTPFFRTESAKRVPAG